MGTLGADGGLRGMVRGSYVSVTGLKGVGNDIFCYVCWSLMAVISINN